MKDKKLYYAFSFIIACFFFITSFKSPDNKELKSVKVIIVTDFGVIKIKLYDETPLHRDNFIKLINTHYYDSLLFHRILQNFVIQGGDPDSRRAIPLAKIGNGDPGYIIASEIDQKFFHKKGALAATSNGDYENPARVSSGSQFYIVQGTVYKESMLDAAAQRITKTKLFNKIINRPENKSLLTQYQLFSQVEALDSLSTVNAIIMKQVEAELTLTKPYTFSGEQIKAYTTIGGIPHLDEGYTVFGEVIEGLSIIDEIAKQSVDKNGRPLTDIRMKMAVIQ